MKLIFDRTEDYFHLAKALHKDPILASSVARKAPKAPRLQWFPFCIALPEH